MFPSGAIKNMPSVTTLESTWKSLRCRLTIEGVTGRLNHARPTSAFPIALVEVSKRAFPQMLPSRIVVLLPRRELIAADWNLEKKEKWPQWLWAKQVWRIVGDWSLREPKPHTLSHTNPRVCFLLPLIASKKILCLYSSPHATRLPIELDQTPSGIGCCRWQRVEYSPFYTIPELRSGALLHNSAPSWVFKWVLVGIRLNIFILFYIILFILNFYIRYNFINYYDNKYI